MITDRYDMTSSVYRGRKGIIKQTEETMKTDTVFCCCCFFWLGGGVRLYVPGNNFSIMSGRSHRLLGITSTLWEVNVSCSRIQHGDPSEDRNPDLSLRSPTLYH